jgi:hypothetical protein
MSIRALLVRRQRALLDLQRVARDLLDALADRPAVLRSQGERLEDDQVERPLREVDLRLGHRLPFHFYRRPRPFL